MPVFDLKKQLTFYGAYHNNKTNVAIHITCVPLLIWSAQVILASFGTPWKQAGPILRLGKHLDLTVNWASLMALVYVGYYYTLEPIAAFSYMFQALVTVMSATNFASRPNGLKIAAGVHVISWILQFIGHGVYEGRAPALLDNLFGAIVLAPFFVHLEVLMKLGFYPQLQRDLKNSVGVAIAKFRHEEAAKKKKGKGKEKATE